jgi:hypothetical protein
LFGWQRLDSVLDLSDVHTLIVPRWTYPDGQIRFLNTTWPYNAQTAEVAGRPPKSPRGRSEDGHA